MSCIISLYRMIFIDFDCATVLISFGAVIGKISPVQLVIMALCEVPVVIANILLAEEVFVVRKLYGISKSWAKYLVNLAIQLSGKRIWFL